RLLPLFPVLSLSAFFRPSTPMLSPYPMRSAAFQSLSGFFRPCNYTHPHHYSSRYWFQSLSGFFRPCNPIPGGEGEPNHGFNPCRVFSGLATRDRDYLGVTRLLCFNPCRVFSGLSTVMGVTIHGCTGKV